MSDGIWMLTVNQSNRAANLIVNTLSKDKGWSAKDEKLCNTLCHALIMQYSYKLEILHQQITEKENV